MMLEAVPPGQQATRISPTASPCCSPIAWAMAKPVSGMIANWATRPIASALGMCASCR
jgi:hypothetical protein